MTVAFDAFSNLAAFGEISWPHLPIGTPRGVIVHVAENDAADNVTGVTYGGVAMAEVVGSPQSHSGLLTVSCWFLGASIPTGEQTVVVSIDQSQFRRAAVITLTADGDTEVVDTGTINGSAQTNPSVVLSLGSRTSFASIGFMSGLPSVANITELTNWTARLEHDFSAEVCGWYTYDIIASSDVTAGWTQIADDAVAIALAVSEVVGGLTRQERFSMLNFWDGSHIIVTQEVDGAVGAADRATLLDLYCGIALDPPIVGPSLRARYIPVIRRRERF